MLHLTNAVKSGYIYVVKQKIYSGQVGLILLIVLGLLITLIMSMASRTLSDTVLSRQDKEQSATFAIAETGVEEALKSIREGQVPAGSLQVTDSLNNITGQYLVAQRNNLEIFLKEGESTEIDLTGTVTPTLTISWTKKNAPVENVSCQSEGSGLAPAALELVTISNTLGVLKRQYFNPSNCPLVTNGFTLSAGGSDTYLSNLSWSVDAGGTSVRIRTIYNGATVSVNGVSLPPQQFDIQSQAKGGDANKQIEVKRTIDNAPGIFDYALFSGSTIVK
ncbi:MAG: hypothetical protein WCL07_02750 [bacterium]